MIEVGRRGFITGLIALTAVSAPAVIRVAPLMRISKRFTPMYVPVNWLLDTINANGFVVPRRELELHSWPRPMGSAWIDLNDYDPDFVRGWASRLEEESNQAPRWS